MFVFTGFSGKANTALNNAVNCAEDMGHTYVGSEHLLAGLLKDPTSVAGVVLTTKKITYGSFSEVIKMNIGVGNPTRLTEGDITPRAGKIIKNAVSAAAASGCALAGTEHILGAILREPSCFANRALIKMGAVPSEIYGELSRIFPESTSGSRQSRARDRQTAPQKLSYLEKYGRSLTAAAACGKTDPVTGRDKEIERVIRILCRRTKNNPCLIGEPGVGKTAVAEGLAHRICRGDVPDILKNYEIYSLELTSMVAGAKYRGDFEERIRGCINETVCAGNIILFIDEIHNLVGAGSAEGAVDAANILKPVLARGEIKLIGATTNEEYRKNIEKDAALERRFRTVPIEQPDRGQTLEILKNIRQRYESFHGVKITDEALCAAVDMSVRYITDRFLPDKAIDLIDEAAAGVSIEGDCLPPELKAVELRAENFARKKCDAVSAQDFESAARYRDEEKRLYEELGRMKMGLAEKNSSVPEVDVPQIAQAVSLWTKIPAGELCKSERDRLKNLESDLSRRIIGQPLAVKTVARAVLRGRTGLGDPLRPTGVFLFCGPTGVGKTEFAKVLGSLVFGKSDALIRVDMSEYSEKHSVARLIGSPPGYTGFDEGGQLIKRIRANPYSLLLFDELEKAHPDVFDFLLPVLEEGILTGSDGKTADCRSCIIVMTSNAGARLIGDKRLSVGFRASGDVEENSDIRAAVEGELKRIFPPEFLNRIDETVIFSRLGTEDSEAVTRLMVQRTLERLSAKGITAQVAPEVYSLLAAKGYDKTYGARNLRRVIVNELENPLSEILCSDEAVSVISIGVSGGELTFS